MPKENEVGQFESIDQAKEKGFPLAVMEIDMNLVQINTLASIFDKMLREDVDKPMARALDVWLEIFKEKDGVWIRANGLTFTAHIGGEVIKETADEVIVPTVATMVGIQNSGFKNREILVKSIETLNGKMFIPDGHPVDKDGKFRESVKEDGSGFLTDFILREDDVVPGMVHLLKSDPRNKPIIEDVRKGKMIEVSVGFSSFDLPLTGEFNGIAYDFFEDIVTFDHLARVDRGACNWEDGCGLNRNDITHTHKIWNNSPEGKHTQGAERYGGQPMGEDDDKNGLQKINDIITGLMSQLKDLKEALPLIGNGHGHEQCSYANECEHKVNEKKGGQKQMADTDMTAKVEQLAGDNAGLKSERDALAKKIEEFTADSKPLQEKADAFDKIEEQREADEKKLCEKLVAEIVKINGKDAKDFADWKSPQLEILKESISGDTDAGTSVNNNATSFSGDGAGYGKMGLTMGRYDQDSGKWVS